MFQEKEQFETSSGRIVKVGVDGSVMFDHVNGFLTPESAIDAEEFYQAKRDAELGRWRCPTETDWVAREGVRTADGRTVVVVNERTLDRFWFNERVRNAGADVDVAHSVGRAYFEAHPERKPWQAAKPGEVWILSTADGENAAYSVMTVREAGVVFESDEGRYSLDDADIEEARRIWPEDAS